MYGQPGNHSPMIFDDRRNSAYEKALAQVVTSDSVVLDHGCGLGIFGLLAARLGARKVYMVDPEPLARLAGSIAAANGLEDRITCIEGCSEEVDLPEQVDVIVSASTGNLLFGEDLLPGLINARDRHLAPDGAMVPGRARLRVAPVTSQRLHDKNVAKWSESALGLDFSAARTFASNQIVLETPHPRSGIDFLAPPQSVMEVDFGSAGLDDLECAAAATFEVDAGTCHGLSVWFDLRLGDDWLGLGPQEPATHWRPGFLPIDDPLVCGQGDRIDITLRRRTLGRWHWQLAHGGERRQHSGFFASVRPPGWTRTVAQDAAPGSA